MKKKLLSLLLCIAMMASLAVPAMAAEPAATETPVTTTAETTTAAPAEGHWADETIATWKDRKIINGYADGSFKPDQNITRGEFAAILNNLMVYQKQAENTYGDLKADAWYTEAVLSATAAGVLQGDGVNVRPEADITRQEAAVIFARTMKLTGLVDDKATYTDLDSVATWAKDAVLSMAAKGYMTGNDGVLRPADKITRAEVLTIINNIFAGYFAEAKTVTGDVVGSAIVNVPGVTLKNMKISGDLVISEGVGTGDFTMTNVQVGGKLIVRGGGENSIHIKGKSTVAEVSIDCRGGNVRVVASNGAEVEVVYIEDGKDDVIIEGTFANVTVDGNAPLTLKNATVGTVTATGKDADITVDSKSAVKTVATKAENTKITVAGTVANVAATKEATGVSLDVKKGGTATSVTTAAAGSLVKNDGKVGAIAIAKGADTTYAKGTNANKPAFTAEDKTNLSVTTIAAQEAQAAAAKAEADRLAAEKLAAEAKTDEEKAAAQAAADQAAADKVAAEKAQADSKKEADKVKEETDKSVVEKPVAPPAIKDDGGVTVPDEKPAPPSGGGSGSGGGSVTPTPPPIIKADIKAAPLHDARNTGSADAGTFVPDGKIIENYTATGIVHHDNATEKIVDVEFTGTHLMKHGAGDQSKTPGFWVGIAVPAVESETYAYARGAYPNVAPTFDKLADGTYTEGGKTYNSFYFNVENEDKTAYLAVKTPAKGEVPAKITVYNLDFSRVTMADPIENVRTFVVYNAETYNMLPAEYVNQYPVKNIDFTAASFPWLAVTYDSNVTGAINFAVKQDNVSRTADPASADTTTINPNRFQSWCIMGTQTGEHHLDATSKFGTFELTLTKDGQTVTQTVTHLDKDAKYYDVTFMNGNTTVQTLKMLKDAVITAPEVAKTGYTLAWNTKADGKGTALTSGTTKVGEANVTYYAQWTAVDQTLTYNYQGATAGNTPENKKVKFDAVYGELPTPTKTNYTLKGWYTAAVDGTEVTAATKMTTLGATIYAQWTAVPALTVVTAGSGAGIVATTTAATIKGDVTTYAVTLSGNVAASSTGTEALNYPIVNGMLAVAGQKHTYVTFNDLIPTKATTTIVQTNPALMYYTTDGVNTEIKLTDSKWEKTKSYTIADKAPAEDYSVLLLAGQNVTLKVGGNAIYEITNSVKITSAPAATSYELAGDMTIKTGATFTVAEGKTLTIPKGKTLTVAGTLNILGTVVNNGTIAGAGTITGAVTVKDAAGLTATLAATAVTKINIVGTIGSADAYGTYTVARAVEIKGGTVYGSFIVTADGATFDGVTIYNEGGISTLAARNAINAYCATLTIKGCTFNSGSAFANGVVIFPSDATGNNYAITENTFIGYKNGVTGWSTTAVLISSGYVMTGKAFFNVNATSTATDMDNADDLAIINGNTFTDCKNDYTRNTYEGAPSGSIYCTANSSTSNFRLQYAAAAAKFYVNGDITMDATINSADADWIIKSGSELIIAAGKTLTIPATKTLTNNGTIANAGTITNNGTLTNTGTISGAGTMSANVLYNLENGITGVMKKTSDTAYTLTLSGTGVASGVPKDGVGEALENCYWASGEQKRGSEEALNTLFGALNPAIAKYTAVHIDYTKFATAFGKPLLTADAKYVMVQSGSPYLAVYADDDKLTEADAGTDCIYKNGETWCKRITSSTEGALGSAFNGQTCLGMLIADTEVPTLTFKTGETTITITIVNNIAFS